MSAPPSFSPGRTWSSGLSVAVSVAAALGLLGLVNYLGIRHFARFHWTANLTYRISPQTERLLKSLTNDVKVVVFYNKREPLYGSVAALLKEYALATPRVQLEEVDYPRDLAGAKLVKERYKLSFSGDKDAVIFEAAGRTKTVFQNQLSDFDLGPLMRGETNEVRRTAFKGEPLFTAAILSVTDPRPRKACFLLGHREHDIQSDDAIEGYSKFALILQQQNVTVERLFLRGTNDVPADCDLLVIPGPQEQLHESELAKVEKYLNRGGRLLALLRSLTANGALAHTGVETLLARWGVEVGDNLVMDPSHSIRGLDLVTTNFTGHPIVRTLASSQIYLYLPRSVDRQRVNRTTADAAKVEELFLTSARGEARTDLRKGVANATPDDRHGAIPLAAAIEQGNILGVNASRGATRLVVVGESIFLGNTAISNYGNYDFGVLAVNWLLDRPQLQGGPGPRPIREYKLNMTQSERQSVRWALLAGLPGGILLLGVLVWWRRRS